jgi:predicted ribonuclease YlaK
MTFHISDDLEYVGYKKWTPSDLEWVNFLAEKKIPFRLDLNEYLLVYDKEKNLSSQWIMKKDGLKKIGRSSIKVLREEEKDSLEEEKKKRKRSDVYNPKNDEQICAFDLVKDPDTTIKLLTGTWGCGKSMILIAAALEALNSNKFEKIIWIRNNVDVKDTKDLGALPGEVLDKLLPYLGPFIDHVGVNKVRTMINKGSLCVEPLQSLRGRNFKNSLIICSEAENLTKEHIQLIIARAAEGSEVWFDADNRQRDKAAFEKSKGVETMIKRLAGEELFGYVHLVKSERSATAALADKLN